MPRNPKPIESFGPELLQALLEGAKREIRLPLPYKKAVHLMHRLNGLRKVMKDTNHPEYTMAAQCRARLTWPEGTPTKRSTKNVMIPTQSEAPCVVILSPADSEYADVFAKAGIKAPELSSDPIAAASPEAQKAQPTIEDDILSRYINK